MLNIFGKALVGSKARSLGLVQTTGSSASTAMRVLEVPSVILCNLGRFVEFECSALAIEKAVMCFIIAWLVRFGVEINLGHVLCKLQIVFAIPRLIHFKLFVKCLFFDVLKDCNAPAEQGLASFLVADCRSGKSTISRIIIVHGQGYLLEIINGGCSLCSFSYLLHRGQQHANCDCSSGNQGIGGNLGRGVIRFQGSSSQGDGGILQKVFCFVKNCQASQSC